MASVRKREWTYKGEAKTAWVVAYTDGGGKRRLKTFDKKKDADKYRTQVETEVEKGAHVAGRASVKMNALMDEFLRTMEVKRQNGRMSLGRIRQVTTLINTHYRPAFGAVMATELTERQIEQAIISMSQRNAPHTMQAHLRDLRLICDFGIRRKYLSQNPAREIMRERGGVERPSIRTFTPEDISKLILTLEKRPPAKKAWSWGQLTCWVHIGAFCGLRIGEIAGLTLPNVDVARRKIYVRHNLTVFGELKGPKSKAGIRDVPMPPHVAALLQQWIDRFYIPNDEQLLFRARGADVIFRPPNFWKMWKNLLALAGVHDDPVAGSYHFHALRHFATSFMIEHGMSIPETSAVIGHAKVDMTLSVYTHPFLQDERQALTMGRMATALIPLRLVSDATQTITQDGAPAT
jgi:integrase